MYAIVDIETTGTNASYNCITEVAIYIHNGEKIVDEWHSLINPQSEIPNFIIQMTGISNEMVETAPNLLKHKSINITIHKKQHPSST